MKTTATQRCSSVGAALAVFACLAIASAAAQGFGEGDAAFSVAYFKQSFNRTKNSLVSPVAVRLTFAALYEVAEPGSRDVVRRAFSLPTATAASRRNAVQFVNALDGKSYVKLSFGVFKTSDSLSTTMADSVRAIFKVSPQTVAFSNRKTVARTVNEWADAATGGLVQDYLAEDEIDVNAELLLLNALLLKANWAKKFDAKRTITETFEYLSGPADVQLMTMTEDLRYKAYPKFQAVQLPFSTDSDLTMWILLPHQGGTLDDLVEALSVDLLGELKASLKAVPVDLWLPRFTIKHRHNPRDVLVSLGHGPIFDGYNFRTFASHRSSLGVLKQSATISVDEDGTEAAAVTGVGSTIRPQNTQFVANKPFVFLIKKVSTDTVLFIGHYANREE